MHVFPDLALEALLVQVAADLAAVGGPACVAIDFVEAAEFLVGRHGLEQAVGQVDADALFDQDALLGELGMRGLDAQQCPVMVVLLFDPQEKDAVPKVLLQAKVEVEMVVGDVAYMDISPCGQRAIEDEVLGIGRDFHGM